MQWDEAMFLRMTEGSAIRRIGHVRWLRNLAIAVGNALRQAASRWQSHASDTVRETVAWALKPQSMHP